MTTARTGRVNRYGLALVGVLLAAGGAAALTVGLGVFGAMRAHILLLTPAQSRYVHDNTWFWPAAAAIGAVVALGCLRWLLAQTRRDRVGELRLETNRRRGTTRIDSQVATDALETEIGSYPGVTRARGRLTGTRRPRTRPHRRRRKTRRPRRPAHRNPRRRRHPPTRVTGPRFSGHQF